MPCNGNNQQKWSINGAQQSETRRSSRMLLVVQETARRELHKRNLLFAKQAQQEKEVRDADTLDLLQEDAMATAPPPPPAAKKKAAPPPPPKVDPNKEKHDKHHKEQHNKHHERHQKEQAQKEKSNKERSKEHHAKHQEHHAKHEQNHKREQASKEKHHKFHEIRHKADVKYNHERSARHSRHHANIRKLQLILSQADARRKRHYDNYQAGIRVWQAADHLVKRARTLPANTRFGNLPAMAAYQGYLRIQQSSNHEQKALIKFPTKILRSVDSIVWGFLKLFKYGGRGGPATVNVVPCEWTRETVTYTRAMNLVGTRASVGTTARFSESQRTWAKIKLKGDVLNRARLKSSTHICLEVSGGPSHGACIVSSELTRQQPILELWVAQGQHTLNYNPGGIMKNKKARVADKAKDKAKKQMDAYQSKMRATLTKQFTKEINDRKKREVEKQKLLAKKNSVDKQAAANAKTAVNIKTKTAGAISAKVQAKTKEIQKVEKAKMEAQLQKSGMHGQQLVAMRANLEKQTQQAIVTKTKAAIKQMEAEAAGAAKKEETRLALKNAKIKAAEKAKEVEIANKAKQLTNMEQAEVKRKTDAALNVAMAKYMEKLAKDTNGATAKPAKKGDDKKEKKAIPGQKAAAAKGQKTAPKKQVLREALLPENEGVTMINGDESASRYF
jgi:hypothetical protein